MARAIGKIVKYRYYLTERLDPDTLVDCLLAKTILSKREVNKVKSRPTICQKNERLLDYIIAKDDEEEFISALRDSKQQHLVNYLLNDGVRCRNTLEDWPLEETQIRIIDVNCGSLKDLIDMRGGLVDELLAKRVISHRQKQLICSKATDSEKNDAFLDILRRGSIRDYKNTIQSLRDSNQEHIAEVLHDGGAVLSVHVELQEPADEVRLVEIFEDLLRGRTVEEFNRIVEMKRHKVIAAKLGHSITFYCYCKTSKLWQELKKSIRSGSLKVTIEELCKRMNSETGVVIKAIHVRAPDYEKIDRYFASKGNRCLHILLHLNIILVCIGIILGIADLYARQTIPCYTKWLECQEARDKVDVMPSAGVRFTLKFEQMRNARSELFKAVVEHPNKEDLISLVVKMYKTPNEETRPMFTELIRSALEELTDKAGKHEIYEETLTEKLTAAENSMQETVLALIEFIKETKGVNNLLRKILENFQEDGGEVCSDTPDIEESLTRGLRELEAGMLRLTCLMSDTVRMARLVRKLNTQATSLKQEVDRMVEEVNEFAEKSMLSLLTTLLTVTKQKMPNKLKKTL